MQQSPQPTLFWFLAPLLVDSLLIRSLMDDACGDDDGHCNCLWGVVIDSAEVWQGNSCFMEDLYEFLKNDVFWQNGEKLIWKGGSVSSSEIKRGPFSWHGEAFKILWKYFQFSFSWHGEAFKILWKYFQFSFSWHSEPFKMFFIIEIKFRMFLSRLLNTTIPIKAIISSGLCSSGGDKPTTDAKGRRSHSSDVCQHRSDLWGCDSQYHSDHITRAQRVDFDQYQAGSG